MERNVGRLIEVRVVPPLNVAVMHAGRASLVEAISRVVGRAVLVLDQRRVRVMPAKGLDALAGFMREDNPRIERSALLLPADNAILSMQIQHAIRAAGNPERRAFTDCDQCRSWLEEVLSDDELARLQVFLDEPIE